MLQAQVTDAFGNPIANVPVTFSAPAAGPAGNFNALPTVVTNALGVATAPALTANDIPGNFTVTAAAAGIAPVTFSLTNTAVPSAITVLAGSGQTATVNSAYHAPLQAVVTDADGNPVSGITVVFTLPTSGPGGSFTGSATVLTNANGVASAPGVMANTQAGTFIVRALVAGVASGARFSLSSIAAAPAAIAPLAGAGQAAKVNTAFTKVLQARVTDAFGNPVAGAGDVHGARRRPGATFAGKLTASAVTNSNGVASAPALTTNTHAGNFVVTASVGGVTTPASFSLTTLPGPAAKLTVVAGTPQSAAPARPMPRHFRLQSPTRSATRWPASRCCSRPQPAVPRAPLPPAAALPPPSASPRTPREWPSRRHSRPTPRRARSP